LVAARIVVPVPFIVKVPLPEITPLRVWEPELLKTRAALLVMAAE
jgi:hypothetical protein